MQFSKDNLEFEFKGFPEYPGQSTSIPEPFFSQLLPVIDHLGELKITIYFFWRFELKEGAFRYLTLHEIKQDRRLMSGFASLSNQAEMILVESLNRAVKRRTILEAELKLEGRFERLYFLNSPKGRAAINAIEKGEWRHSADPQAPVELFHDTSNIFHLYEENIGLLTPMISESISDAQDTYPLQWIEDAMRIAVENNKRSWRYIEAILKRWQQEGRDERKTKRDTEKARRKYSDWEE